MARSVASARCCVFVCTDIVMVLLWCSVSVAHQTNVNGNGLDMHASIWYLFTTMVLLEIIAELLLPGEAGAAEPTATSDKSGSRPPGKRPAKKPKRDGLSAVWHWAKRCYASFPKRVLPKWPRTLARVALRLLLPTAGLLFLAAVAGDDSEGPDDGRSLAAVPADGGE
jgi:hypothetical protein